MTVLELGCQYLRSIQVFIFQQYSSDGHWHIPDKHTKLPIHSFIVEQVELIVFSARKDKKEYDSRSTIHAF